jgi:DNA polymerase-3 subunit gamma/tau
LNAIDSNHLALPYYLRDLEELEKRPVLVFVKNQSTRLDDPTEDFAFNVFELDAASNNSVDDIRA